MLKNKQQTNMQFEKHKEYQSGQELNGILGVL